MKRIKEPDTHTCHSYSWQWYFRNPDSKQLKLILPFTHEIDEEDEISNEA